jgi:hypothetical protein
MVLTAAGLLFAAEVASAAPARTRVTIQSEQTGFSGYVSSTRESCANGRRVLLYRRQGTRNVRVGSDIAQANGDRFQWAIQVPQGGKYFAAVRRTRSCYGARSRLASPQPAPPNGAPPGP